MSQGYINTKLSLPFLFVVLFVVEIYNIFLKNFLFKFCYSLPSCRHSNLLTKYPLNLINPTYYFSYLTFFLQYDLQIYWRKQLLSIISDMPFTSSSVIFVSTLTYIQEDASPPDPLSALFYKYIGSSYT